MHNTPTTSRVVLVAITVDSAATDTDLTDAVRARLGEFYPDADGITVPSDVRATSVSPEIAAHIGGALWVGLGNEDEIGDAALTAAHVLNLDGLGAPSQP